MGTTEEEYSEKNKEHARVCLREFCRREKWRELLKNTKIQHSSSNQKITINETTIYHIIADGYDVTAMRARTFHQIVLFLKLKKYWLKQTETTSQSQEEIATKFNLALKQFNNLQLFSYEDLADKMVGQYQGYRWSVSEPGYLVFFSLVIAYDEKNDLLTTKEITRNRQNNAQDLFEGVINVNFARQNIRYIVAREKQDSAIIGLQFTILHSCLNGENGKIATMDGAMLGRSNRGPFVRTVGFNRLDDSQSPEIDIIPPDPKKHDKIVKHLNRILLDIQPLQFEFPQKKLTSI